MDCKFSSETVKVCKCILDTASEHPVDSEIVLPDYCPDMGKILKCMLLPCVLSKNYSEKSVIIEGSCTVRIIYSDEKNGDIKCCEQELAFDHEIPLKEYAPDIEIFAECKTDYVNCRAVSKRRVDIHGAFTVKVRCTAETQYSLINSAEGGDCMLKRESISVNALCSNKASFFSISDTSELPSGKPSVGNIICSDVYCNITETKIVAGKLIVRGDARVHILYSSDDDEARLETMEYSLPINQIADAEGADEDGICTVNVRKTAVKISAKTDGDGEYRLLSSDITLELSAAIYKNTDITYVTDCYCTSCEVEAEYQNIQLCAFAAALKESVTQKYSIELPYELEEVYDIWAASAGCNTKQKEDGVIKAVFPAMLCVLGRDTDGNAVYSEKTIEIVYNGTTDEKYTDISANFYLENLSYTLSSGKIDVRISGSASLCLTNTECLRAAVEITPDQSRPKNCDNRSAFTVYFAEKGESVWQIALDHNCSVQKLMEQNDISDDILTENKMLLIS